MKSTFSIKKLIMIFLIIIIVALIIDYYNVMYPISKNFNYNFFKYTYQFFCCNFCISTNLLYD